ncbi:hypothetical protein HYDPIDRAFT_186269 [Hydnomerulius pinastri MD-312]|nr:hypothetical protein HYDPIDRAFT_186269 [Hydnomerulius pinastri MD-312]
MHSFAPEHIGVLAETIGANQSIVSVVFDYSSSKPAAGTAGALYLIATLCLFARLFANRTWWGLCLPIASAVMMAGFFLRIPMAIHPNTLPIFLVQQFFIFLPPAAFLAFNYIVYGRFIVTCADRRYSWIRPERVARYFVISDVTTFLIQASGGVLQASSNASMAKNGVYILLGGLVLQTISFALYMLLAFHAYSLIKKDGITPQHEPWGTILSTLTFTSICFMVGQRIRCIYRVIEFAQGNGGYLMTHEVFFYILDPLPLLLGIAIYIFYWPSKYLVGKEMYGMSQV